MRRPGFEHGLDRGADIGMVVSYRDAAVPRQEVEVSTAGRIPYKNSIRLRKLASETQKIQGANENGIDVSRVERRDFCCR